MKVHIIADMEGIATICHDIQTDDKGDDFPRMREIMTGEAQVAIEGAREAGATKTVICDAHAVRQAKALIKNVVVVPTKEGVGLHAVRALTPDKACELIRKGAKEALGLVQDLEPFTVKKPVMMEVEFERPLICRQGWSPGENRSDMAPS